MQVINNRRAHTSDAASHSTEPVETSSSIQEIVSSRPGLIARSGLIVIFMILLLILSAMWFIRYPDTLEGAAVISTDPLPIKLKSLADGRIFNLYTRENELVAAAQPIAEIENTTGYENVLSLQALADSLQLALLTDDIARLNALSGRSYASLGEAQPIFNSLSDALAAYILLRSQRIYAKRNKNLQARMAGYRSLSGVSEQEQVLINEALLQATERFQANETLYRDKIISRQEYQDESDRIRQKKLAIESQRRAALQQGVIIAESDKEMLDLRYEQGEREMERRAAILSQLRNLQNFIRGWRLKYLVAAPFEGRVHFLKPLQINEAVAADEAICAVVPATSRYMAMVILPAYGMGKVQVGQEVQLMPDQYPRNEYGYLQGRVSHIAAMPEAGQGGASYRVSVTLPDRLTSSFNKTLIFSPEMSARANVITKDRNMLQRLFSGVVGRR
jgi:HlyD family secretion protein